MRFRKISFIYVFSLLYFALFASLTYLRWKGHSPSLDYQAYLQMYWNTTNGDILMYNRNNEAQYSLFSAHFAPFLLFIFPFYLFIRHALTLYFVFGFIISLSFIPLYFFALNILKSKLSAFLVVFSFFVYFPFSWTHRHGFAEEAFATPLLFFAFYFLHKKRPWLFLLFCFLTLSLRIDMIIPVFLLGMYAIITDKARGQGVYLCILSVFWLYFIINVIYPKYSPPGATFYVFGFFGDYGHNFREISSNMLSHPLTLFKTLVSKEKIKYLIDLFGPVLFLPFFAPEILFIGIPVLILDMLGNYERLSNSWTYYHSSSLPFIWFGLCVALERLANLWNSLLKKLPSKTNILVFIKQIPIKPLFINLTLLIIFFLNLWITIYTPNGQNLPFSTWFNLRTYELNKRDKLADEILTNIPKTNSLAVQYAQLDNTAERKWTFSVSNFEGYMSDMAMSDTWAENSGFRDVSADTTYTKILEDSFFFLYARDDLIKEYAISDFINSTYKTYDENSEYTVVSKPADGYSFYTSVEPGISIDINERYRLAQKLEIQRNDPYILEMPIEIENHVGPNDLLSVTKKYAGNLKVNILEGEDFINNHQVIYEAVYKPESISHKTTLIYINLQNLRLNEKKTYWLTLSLDQTRQNKKQLFNSYKIYLATISKDSQNKEKISNFYYTLNGGRTWSSKMYHETDITYSISYGRLSLPYPKNTLDNGSFIIKGTPSFLKDRLRDLINYTNDYKNVTVIGLITEKL